MTTRVLLISPLPGLDPFCGDVVYTEGLLKNPPSDVVYETHDVALAAGRLREIGRRADVQGARGASRAIAVARAAREKSINSLRGLGLMFREPFRHFAVLPGAYDLVHCHVYSASFRLAGIPLVISNANTIEDLYRGARQWSPRRLNLASRLDSAAARSLGVQHTSHDMYRADAVVCFSEKLKQELLRRGAARPDQLHVAPCFVEAPARPWRKSARPHRIGFVASDFRSKGGNTVLEAFEIVRRARPDAELLIVGSDPPSKYSEPVDGITWLPHVPRQRLLEQCLPGIDVFAYPTEFDGLPLTVLEVMALGIPVATSDYGAMPEVVGWGQAGSVTPQRDSKALARSLLHLLEEPTHDRVRSDVLTWFSGKYSVEAATRALRLAYTAALNEPRRGYRGRRGT